MELNISSRANAVLNVSGIFKEMGTNHALSNISFELRQSGKLAIAGETGSGKSTLLKIISGLLQPDAGTVLFNGARVKGPDEKLIAGHNSIAYLSQQYELRNNYRVEELLEMANKMPLSQAATIYEVCRISHLVKRWTNELSGGEKQRIALARLLITSPQLLILDEPFSNLDPIHKNILKGVLKDIGDQLDITCILASHEPHDTLAWADDLLVLRDGIIVQRGTPEELYRLPANEYVAALLGPYMLLNDTQAGLWGIAWKSNDDTKRLLVRPEQFKLTPEGPNTIAGRVTSITFLGGFYEIEVQLTQLSIRVLTLTEGYVTGDTAYVSLQLSRPHYV